jgi:hypothetical protein
MPEKLKKFLMGLSNEEAYKLWDWLDGNPEAIIEMVGVLDDTHEEPAK